MFKKFLPLALLAFLLGACHSLDDHSHDGDYGHDHSSEEASAEPLVYTLYTEKTELFVEFAPLTVGQESRFAAHFTHLGETFTPFTSGSVDLTMNVDGKKTVITASEPQVPGIFRLAVTPDQAGRATLTFDISANGSEDQIVIDSLTVYSSIEETISQQTEASALGEVTYLKEQAWKVEFVNEELKRRPFHNVLKTSGELISAPGDEVMMVSKSPGIVLFNGSAPIAGSTISKGKQLFSVSGSDMATGNMETEYQRAKIDLDKAKIDHDRSKALYEDDVISLRDYQDMKVVYDNALNSYQTIARNHSKDGQKVSAPMTGFIKNVFVTEGQYVEAGAPLATISKNEKLVLRANVSQRYFAQLPTIRAANFTCPMNKVLKSTDDLNGRVLSYGKSATDGSPFIPINFEIDNCGELVPGSMVEVYLLSDTIQNALVIPRNALMEQQGKLYVFVQISGEGFDKKEVTLGADDGEYVQVLSGLREGDRVVTKGAYHIKLASASGAIPEHGHEH